MGPLPHPVSVTDDYLAAMLGVLGEIRDRLPEPKQQERSGPTRVSEPAKQPAKRAGRSRGGS